MAGRGPTPRDHASRERDLQRRTAPRAKVATDDVLRGPDLPSILEWHPLTVAWWQTWRTSPLSQAWLATDWDFLLDTALMHSAMWTTGQWTMAAELRLRVAKLGATIEDRQRLRISIDEPIKNAPSVSIMEQYRTAAGE